jgi:hypothetical protein
MVSKFAKMFLDITITQCPNTTYRKHKENAHTSLVEVPLSEFSLDIPAA